MFLDCNWTKCGNRKVPYEASHAVVSAFHYTFSLYLIELGTFLELVSAWCDCAVKGSSRSTQSRKQLSVIPTNFKYRREDTTTHCWCVATSNCC